MWHIDTAVIRSRPDRLARTIVLLARWLVSLPCALLGYAVRGVVALLFALRTLRLFSSTTLAAQASNLAIYFGVDKFVSGESLVLRHDAIILHAASQVRQEREPEEDLKGSGNSRNLSARTGNEILGGSILVAVGAFLSRTRYALPITALVLIVVGVGALFGMSALGGVGGNTGRSMWWLLLCVPYPIGWILGLLGAASILREPRNRDA